MKDVHILYVAELAANCIVSINVVFRAPRKSVD